MPAGCEGTRAGHQVGTERVADSPTSLTSDVSEQVHARVVDQLARDLDQVAVLVGTERALPERRVVLRDGPALSDDRSRPVGGRDRNLDGLPARGLQDGRASRQDRGHVDHVLDKPPIERRRDGVAASGRRALDQVTECGVGGDGERPTGLAL